MGTETHAANSRTTWPELKWKELEARMSAYRSYIQLILGVNGFYYATTGAVMLFALKGGETNRGAKADLPVPVVAIFLLLPILMGVIVGGFMIYAVSLQRYNEIIIEQVRKDLKIAEIPDLGLLRRLLLVFGLMFFIVAIALNVVLFTSSTSVWAKIAGVVIVFCGFAISRCAFCRYWRRKNLYWGSGKLKSPSDHP